MSNSAGVVIVGVGGLLGVLEDEDNDDDDDDDDDEDEGSGGVLRLMVSCSGSALTSAFSSAFGSVEVEATGDAGFEVCRPSCSKARAKVRSRMGEPVERLGVMFPLGA